MKLLLHPIELKLKHHFKIAHDSRDVQKALIVELQHGAWSGFGEVSASKYYKHSIEDMRNLLEEQRSVIESYDFEKPALFWEKIKTLFSSDFFAFCALDVAVNDLYAKSKNQSLIETWELGQITNGLPTTNYTIGIDTIEKMVEKLTEFPWPLYKIKLGTNEDLRIIKELRKRTNSIFRVDANCGWTVEETLVNAEEMKYLGVEFIEQPLPAGDWGGMKILFKKSVLPIIADESLINEFDVKRCVGHFHGINIKLMKCGGFTPALRMIKEARSLGMKVMVGCMNESSVGISAIGQLRPLLDYVDMDGTLLITNDIASGPRFVDGKVIMPEGAGIGIEKLNL
ncbi:MAG: L-alanine-DL-glutamate epimerase-like enolase superfamily enzyme [Cyclobacteriaceae bacterium]|jgi:L-alanine-DL-glutamate epimerase-like enolase superfamily enzyme